MKDTIYFRQANLLLDILPILNMEKRFALRGGTALNFFIRDLPRLSVDIDLTYLPIEDRETTLINIDTALRQIPELILARISGAVIAPKVSVETGLRFGLIVRRSEARIKIEPSTILRGFVFPPQIRNLSVKAQAYFEKGVRVQLMSFADLYGGKICAALDRQHPRDLFDVKLLLENEGFTNEVRQAFIAYLISHSRPMVELLNPSLIEINSVYNKEFKGLTFDDVNVDELKEVRTQLISLIKSSFTDEEKQFIISIETGEPYWRLFPIDSVRNLPGVLWKLENIHKMSKMRHKKALDKLKAFLSL